MTSLLIAVSRLTIRSNPVQPKSVQTGAAELSAAVPAGVAVLFVLFLDCSVQTSVSSVTWCRVADPVLPADIEGKQPNLYVLQILLISNRGEIQTANFQLQCLLLSVLSF